MSIVFAPVPSTKAFFVSDSLVSACVGPVGSTKTSTGIMKIAFEAAMMAPGIDGIRRSRCAVVRNTRQMLLDSTIPDFFKWFQDGVAGTYIKTEGRFLLKFNDVECDIMFRGLDDANDVRRLLSLNLSFAMVDEVREINPEVFNQLTTRVGRYPDKTMVPHKKGWPILKNKKGEMIPSAGCVDEYGREMKKVWVSTNPPSMDTFWYENLSNPPEITDEHTGEVRKWHVTVQPSALSQEQDWAHLIPSANYYEDLVMGKTQDWIDVYVHGKWGISLSGKPVISCFQQEHVASKPLAPIKLSANPIIIGMDFGLNPSAVIGQIDPRGRILILDEITGVDMGLVRFIDTKLKPLLASKYAGYQVLVVGDPAGTQRQQGDEKSCFDILKGAGFKAIPAKTNSIVLRVAAVETALTKFIDGQAGCLIDPACRKLISALRGEYRYKLKKNGEYEPSPEKNMASHIADAAQYFCLHVSSPTQGANWQSQRREIKPVSYRAWA